MASFKASFAAARKAGKKTFSWNGKSYNTKLASSSSLPKAGPVPGKRPTSGSAESSSTRARADFPKPARAVGIAKAGSRLARAAAKTENKPSSGNAATAFAQGSRPKGGKKPVQGPVGEGVWYARKGSAMSIAAARRANKPISRDNAATAYALGLSKKKPK